MTKKLNNDGLTPLSDYRSDLKGFPDLLNYGFMIDEGVYLNKDGSLSAGFYYRASDISSSTEEDKFVYSSKMNQLLTDLGTGWIVHIDSTRNSIMDYPSKEECYFENEVNKLIDEERRQLFSEEGRFFESIFTIILTFQPPHEIKGKLVDLMFDDEINVKHELGTKVLAYFNKITNEFQSFASNIINIQKMLPYTFIDEFNQEHTRDQYLEFVNFAIVGKYHPINVPPNGSYLDSYIGSYPFFGGVTPRIDDHFIGIVAINGFPQESIPNMLEILSNLEITYRWNTRFIFRDSHEAKKDLEKFRKKWNQKTVNFLDRLMNKEKPRVDNNALNMVNEADSASAELGSGLVGFGYYNSNIILMDTDRERLDYNLQEVTKLIRNLGFTTMIEEVNAIEAYLGSLPSHSIQNVRQPVISTFNLSHLMPLSSLWVGDVYNQSKRFSPNSPALLYTTTQGNTPFKLNLHVKDVGHTFIFGPTGNGKSTALATIASQFKKYKDNQIFAFDKGKSLYALTLASGGTHYEIGSDNNKLQFAPLSNIDSNEKQSWAEGWVETLLELQGVTVTPKQRKRIHEAMNLQKNNSSSSSLTDFVANIQDEELSDALTYYTLDGPMGYMLDGEVEKLDLSNFTVFEIEQLMNLPDKSVVPVLLYIFYKIEEKLDGRPTLVEFDEVWIALAHPVIQPKIKDWLLGWRKKNAAVVLATQTVSAAVKSGIFDVIIESCPTKILLPNPEAFNKGTKDDLGPYDYYKLLGLNDKQINIIFNAISKKEYYYTSREGNRLFDLSLGEVALSFVAIDDPRDHKIIEDFHDKDSKNWIYAWMNYRKVNYTHLLKENK